ncbi:MAG: MOSC domain-containing protein [Solirubrobacteraceae bacterium]
MRLPQHPHGSVTAEHSLQACLAAVLEQDPASLPGMAPEDDGSGLTLVSRVLAGLGLGIARVVDPQTFSWPGPWIARIAQPDAPLRFAVMYGVPSGVVFDPSGEGEVRAEWILDGYLLAATDIALARPALPSPPLTTGIVEQIFVSPGAGAPAQACGAAVALPGRGLEGDRHVSGAGTFPSGIPGSALTLIEAEVCHSFDPPLGPDDHRRNVVTRGLALNDLVGHEFTIGSVHCRGMRLCEPCTVVQRYAGRPVLRELVHRGGLRADILSAGTLRVGDPVRAHQPQPQPQPQS